MFAHRIFDLFMPAAPPPAPESGPPPAVTGDALPELNTKAGLFFNEQTGEPLRLAVDRGRFRVAGGPGLVALTKDRFRRWGANVQFMSGDAFELHFLSPDQLELKSMEGKTTRYRRAQPYTPTDADLKAFAGRYASDELKAVMQLASGKGGLIGRINEGRAAGVPFAPVDRDTFQFGMLTIRFRRDTTGKIAGLEFSNPVLRNVKFGRLSDG
jgi:hypothetical protein